MPDNSPQNYLLITGGTGFLGQRICQQALANGYRVAVLTRNKARAAGLLPAGVQCYESLGKITDLDRLSCVINLVGEPLVHGRWNKARKKEFFSSRVGITQALFDHFKQHNIALPVLISGSAVGYYGPHTDETLDESGVFHDSFSHQLCAAWEDTANQFAELGARVCLIRTGIVLDKEMGALAKMLLPFQWGVGGVMGNGKQWMPWIHIDDYVALIFHCLRRSDLRGAVNGTAPNPVTNRVFTKTLGRVLGRPTFFRMFSPVAKLMFGEMAKELLLSGQKVVPRKALETSFEFQFPELEHALRDLLAQ